MNTLISSGIIDLVDCGNNFAYILKDNNIFNSTEYKVLQSQTESTFVKCMRLLYNGKIQIYYMNTGFKSLLEMLSVLNADDFFTIVLNLYDAVMEVKQNGFLSCQNIDISLEHIFVNPFTYGVSLVYLPLGKRIYNSFSEFENDLRTSLIKLIQNDSVLSSKKTDILVVDLANGMLSFEELYIKISGRKNLDKEKGRATQHFENVKLVAINTPVPFEINITKDDFLIGRKKELVDATISFNKMVGRTHCKIVRQENHYAIIDLHSSNGTYINKVRLQPEQLCPIKNGDIIRLANSEFQVNFY